VGGTVIVGGTDVTLGWVVWEAVAVGVEVERATVSWGIVGTDVSDALVEFGEHEVMNNKQGTKKIAILENFMGDSLGELNKIVRIISP
jgi:hypothetical protein